MAPNAAPVGHSGREAVPTTVVSTAGSHSTSQDSSKAKGVKDWHCPECRRWMTLRQAQRAMEHGCLAGCSGIDIEHVPGGRR
jgi:hypothetical protein